jgi:membrane associated rhomboid family serine protease
MRPAAVGFQCPSCVREGSRQTRSGRTAYGGERSTDPALTSRVLIGLNVLVWLAIVVTGGNGSTLVRLLALRPSGGLVRAGGQLFQLPDGVAQGRFWQVLTVMFTHVEVWHIGFNMLALYALGPALEAAVGRSRFLAVYFGSGLAASATIVWLAPVHGATVGASGAIFGLMGALLVLAVKVRGDVRGMLTWIAINFVITFVFVGQISWQGHVGGFVAGVALGAVLVYAPRLRRAAWQAMGLTAVAVLVLAALVVRIAALAAG